MSFAVSMIGPKFYAWDSDTGKPLAFGRVHTYAAGTSTPKATYTSEKGDTPNPNPVILNGAGYASIYLRGRYKVVVTDANDVKMWSADPVSDQSAQEPWVQEMPASQVSATQFKVAGNRTSAFEAGRYVKVDDSTFRYGSVVDSVYAEGETVVTLDVEKALSSALDRVWLSLLTGEAIIPVKQYSDSAKADSERAETEAVRAENARDAAKLSAGLFPDTTAALAATSDGDYFTVEGGSEGTYYFILYRNNAGVADQINRYPSIHYLKENDKFDITEDAEYIYTIMDEDGYVAMGVTKDGRVKSDSILDPRSADETLVGRQSAEYGRIVGGVVDEDGRYCLAFDERGGVHQGSVVHVVLGDAKDYNMEVLYPITDEDGRVAFGIDPNSGEIIGRLKGESGNDDALVEDIEALGARGTLSEATILDADFYRYTSDVAGGVLPFKRKREGELRAHMLDTSQEVGIHISYGQSWRTMSFDGMRSFVGDAENERNITLFKEGGIVEGPISTGAGISIGGDLTDLANISTDEPFSLGRIAVISYLRHQDQHRLRKAPVAEFCHGWPGSTWDSGDGGGLAPGGDSWANGLILIDAMTEQLQRYDKTPVYRSVAWTQGGDGSKDVAGNIADLQAMMQAYDDLDLPGTSARPLNFYIGLPGGNSSLTEMSDGTKAWLEVCRDNANGRSWLPTPWYPWEYRQTDPADNIHTGPYGMVRHGEMEGYAKFCVEDLGLDWNPLWHSRSEPITVSGDTIVIPFERVTGPAFETATLAWDTETIEQAESYGFRVFVNGSKATISSVAISGLDKTQVTLVLANAPPSGALVEVSYAARDGVEQPPGGHSGLWGNLIMRGATSPLNPRWTLDAWACQFIETLTA